MSRQIAYRRVSTLDQNLARQLVDVRVKLDIEYSDKVSGKDTNRPQLQAMMADLQEGDFIHVHSLDRLARSLQDLMKLVDVIKCKGATVRFYKESLTFTADENNPMSNFMLGILASVAEFERELILERTLEGVAIAKKAGKYKGRKESIDKRELYDKIRELGGMTQAELATELGVSKSTIRRAQAEMRKAA